MDFYEQMRKSWSTKSLMRNWKPASGWTTVITLWVCTAL